MKLPAWRTMALAVIVLAAGCHNSGNDANTAKLRILNAVADAEPLNLAIDGSVKASAVALGTTSSYSEIDTGTRTTDLLSSINGSTLFDKALGYGDGGDYTLAAFGHRAAITVLQLNDDTGDAASGKFRIRVADFAPDAGLVDFYVTTNGVSSVPPTLANLGGGTVSDYIEIAAGTYSFVLTASGTKEIVFQGGAQAIAANAKLTFAALPALGAKLTNATLLSTSGAAFMANPLARVKAVGAIPDAAALTFKSDGATLLAGVPFQGGSSYVTTPVGPHALTLELTSAPGAAIATSSQSLDSARDYTIAAVGTLASPALVVIPDDNSLPAAGYARIRFGNLDTDGAPVDALVNFASQASGIASRSASAYYQVAAGTDYTLSFTSPGGVSVIAAIDSGLLDPGGVYTAYLMGSTAAATIRLVRDR